VVHAIRIKGKLGSCSRWSIHVMYVSYSG